METILLKRTLRFLWSQLLPVTISGSETNKNQIFTKKLFLALGLFLVTTISFSQAVIARQGFDGLPADNLTFPALSGNLSAVNTTSVSAPNSLRLTGSSNSNPELIFGNVDISAYANVKVSVSFASSGTDTGEDLYIEFSSNNGGAWQNSIKLVDGNSNKTFAYGTADAESNPYVFSVTAGQSTLRIRVRATSMDSGEFYYIDNVAITGTSAQSDIIANAGFTTPTNIAYQNHQETNLTASSLEIAQFTIRDGAGSSDADALSTILNSLSFDVTNSGLLRRIALYDGATELSEVAAGATVSFSGLTLTAADNGSKTFSVRASFQSTVTDNQQFSLAVSAATAASANSIMDDADAGGATSSTSGDNNRIEVTATKLAFVQNATNVFANVAMSPAVTVSANDANNNRDLDYTSSVSITSTGTLTGSPVAVSAAAGLATFSGLVHTAAATGRQLTATSGALTNVASATFAVTPVLVTNPITGTNPNTANPYTTGQIVGPNVTASGIGRGNGLTGVNSTDRYNASGFATPSTLTIGNNDYYEFTITPAAGYEIDFSDFIYTGERSSGPLAIAFRSSTNAYGANIGSATVTGTTISLSAAAYQNVREAITFRLYGYDADNGSGTYSVNSFSFTGTTSLIPAPVITSFSPNEYCAANGVITITGTDLDDATLTIGGTPITITSNTSTQIVATVNAGISGTVSVTTPGGNDTDGVFSVSPKPALTLSGSATAICNGSSSALVTVTAGTASYDIFQWTPATGISGDQNSGYTFNPGSTTVYTLNASQSSGICTNSTTYTVTVNPMPAAVVIVPASTTICENSIQQLTATGGAVSGSVIISDDFNITPTFVTAGSNSGGGAIWGQRTSPYTAGVNSVSNPGGSKFMAAHTAAFGSASTNSTLTSQAINTTGFTSLSLSFNHSYKKGSESGVSVQVSIDGGSNWTNLKTYNSTQGNDSTFPADNISMNAYLNQTNLKIRFNYVSNVTFAVSYWAVDNVVLSGSGPSVTWSPQTGLYSDAAATIPYAGGVATTVYAKLTGSASFTATSTGTGNCSMSDNVTLSVNPKPTLTGVAQTANVCPNTVATINLSGLLAGSTSTISYKIGAGAVKLVPGVLADGSGNASFDALLLLGDNAQVLTITNIERTDLAVNCSLAPTVNNTVVLGVNANVTYYGDTDSDGFGDLNTPQVSCFGAPIGYVINSTDCDDTNGLMHASYAFYIDADGDGFGAGSLVTVCAVDANTPPEGYAANNTDCNDANEDIFTTFQFYTDADNDGFGTGGLLDVCAIDANTPPTGYAMNNTDCNDSDQTMHESFFFYADADMDDYGTGSLVEVCAIDANTPPDGYSLNNTDCDDTIAAINPGQGEILYNGIDDNCDGQKDEGNQIVTQVLTAQCGTTLVTINSLIGATTLNTPGITGYRFKVTNTVTAAVQTIDRVSPFFSLTMLASYDYATTYSIAIELQRNAIWLGYYGASCQVSTPAVLASNGAAQVSASQCGITLPSINTLIATTSLQGVTGYRFRITNMTDVSAPNQTQILDRSIHWFSLPMLATYNYGTTYIIEVSVKTNGVYSGFGNPCQVTTPAVPTLTQCGGTIAQANTHIATASLDKVTSYRFEITNMISNVVTIIDRSQNWFTFNNVPGYAPATPYGIRVAVMSSGVWSVFGEACEITSPGAARASDGPKAEMIAKKEFAVTAYPNPFAENFALHLVSDSSENLEVKVYDMLGKLAEVRMVKPEDMDAFQLGANYAAGVYNVIVVQGEHTKTLRVIKR